MKNRCLFCKAKVKPHDGHKRKCEGWQRYKEALARNEKLYAPLIDANRKSQSITGDDLNTRVGGHPDC